MKEKMLNAMNDTLIGVFMGFLMTTAVGIWLTICICVTSMVY